MLTLIVEILVWALIGLLPGFYIFYVRGYDTRLGAVLGGLLGVVIGVPGLRSGIVAGPTSAVVIILGLLGAALLLLPQNYIEGQVSIQRRLLTGLGGVLLILFLMLGFNVSFFGSAIDPGLLTTVALLAYMFVLPRGNYDNYQTNTQRITNLAYALTIPTVLIVMGIVIFPLVWNLIFSVRDMQVRDLAGVELFDLSELTLDNFQAQAGLRVDAVPCIPAETGDGCAVDEAGNTIYENPRRYFDDYRGWREWFAVDIGGTHYAIGVRDPEFYPMILRTIFYTLSSTILAILLGLIAALVVREAFPGRAILRGFILFPYIAPVISVAFIWQALLRQNGFVNGLMGTNIDFLGTRDTFLGLSIPLLMVILFQTWRYFPFAFLFLLARIQAIPDDLYEAAKVDGASPSQTLRFITLPQLRAVFGTLFLLRFIWTFNKFDDVFLLTGPIAQTKVIPIQIFEALFTESNVGEASAVAVIMAVILAVVLIIYFRYFLVEEA